MKNTILRWSILGPLWVVCVSIPNPHHHIEETFSLFDILIICIGVFSVVALFTFILKLKSGIDKWPIYYPWLGYFIFWVFFESTDYAMQLLAPNVIQPFDMSHSVLSKLPLFIIGWDVCAMWKMKCGNQ